MAKIKDSGNRTEFKSGAVRDVQEGKGRCDLLPLPEVIRFIEQVRSEEDADCCSALKWISDFTLCGDPEMLIKAAASEIIDTTVPLNDEPCLFDGNIYNAVLEFSKHLEDGCKKYGARNWEKGIPLDRYIDSGIRHYLKYRRGDTDERHDRAFIWNMLCGAATCRMHPELNTFAKA